VEGEIYSIGHGSRTIANLIEVLDTYKIVLLVDVRRKPYSTWNKDMYPERLRKVLGDRYLWMGDKLGGLSDTKPEGYKEGLQRLIELRKRGNICIMCAELHPAHCHREYWIARDLRAMGIKVHHILGDGSILRATQTYLI